MQRFGRPISSQAIAALALAVAKLGVADLSQIPLKQKYVQPELPMLRPNQFALRLPNQ